VNASIEAEIRRSEGGGVYIRRERVLSHNLPDQSVLLFDEATQRAIPLNESGAQVWAMCDGNHTLEQIAATLASRYDAELSQVDRDTREFLSVLVEHDLVSPRAPS
jgi:Coenzyme PQQ synthesis protein D (PqqD)